MLPEDAARAATAAADTGSTAHGTTAAGPGASETALSEPAAALSEAVAALSEPAAALGEAVAALNEPAAALDEAVAALNEAVAALSEPAASLSEAAVALNEAVAALSESAASLNEAVAALGAVPTAQGQPGGSRVEEALENRGLARDYRAGRAFQCWNSAPELFSTGLGRRVASRFTAESEMAIDPQALEAIYAAKERRRRRLAALPFHEKIRILVSLQKRADSILRSQGRPGRRVWKLPSEP